MHSQDPEIPQSYLVPSSFQIDQQNGPVLTQIKIGHSILEIIFHIPHAMERDLPTSFGAQFKSQDL